MLQNRPEATTHPSLREAIGFWWKLGWISFGGAAADLAIMQSELVEKRRWIDSDDFFHVELERNAVPRSVLMNAIVYDGAHAFKKAKSVLK